MTKPLERIDTAFPGRPAFDVAVSRALLKEVAAGKRPETLRLYQPEAVMAFSVSDLRRPGFMEAVEVARQHGYAATLRLAGGAAALYQPETLALAWCTPESEERRGIHARFEQLSNWIARALSRLGVDARVGEVSGAWCPGDYSVNAGGRIKLAGLGQRLVRGAAYAGGVILIGDSARARAVLEPVYAALGYDYDGSSTGSVADEVEGVSVAAVREALLAELLPDWTLRSGKVEEATLEQAAVYEASYRISD